MENYKQKYKEALERAKQELKACGSLDCDAARQVFRLFPELQSIKNEKIKTNIIKLLRFVRDTHHQYSDECNEAIEWLKKQSDGITCLEDNWIREELIHFLETCQDSRFVGTRKRDEWISWLEKQNKLQVRTGIEWVNIIDDACNHRYAEEYAHGEYCHKQSFKWGFQEGVDWLEKQGEQKPVDKVEPKFKVGDWIINSEGMLRHILAVDKTGYQTDYGWLTHDIYDNTYHLWTIQDARKGDILQANKCTLIFDSLTKDIDDNIVISSWYYCDTKTFYGMGISQSDLWIIEGVVPATKEQCDLLFQKMKEAGYEWDAEKKELIRYEQ